MSRKDDLKFAERHSKGSAIRHKEDVYREELDAEPAPDLLSLADQLATDAIGYYCDPDNHIAREKMRQSLSAYQQARGKQ